jgi:hypothetical protein
MRSMAALLAFQYRVAFPGHLRGQRSLSVESFKIRLDGGTETVYNRPMELVQIKNLFAELKKKTSDLRGFL